MQEFKQLENTEILCKFSLLDHVFPVHGTILKPLLKHILPAQVIHMSD